MIRVRWLFVLFMLLSTRVLAQEDIEALPSEPEQQASEHFERGVALFKEQAFRAASVEFQRAYDLAPDYRLFYNLGRAKHQLQDYLGAAQSFELYLEQGGAEIAAERRVQVEETLAALKTRVARVEIKVSQAGAAVFVDDLQVGTAPLESLVLLNVGRHRVSARAADGAEGAQIIDVAGGDIAEVELTLAEPKRALAPVAQPAPATPERGWSTRRKLGLVGLLAGGALLASSVVTGVESLRAQDRLHDQVGTLGVDPTSVQRQRDKVDTLSMTTDIMIGAGAALAVSGAVLWLLSADRSERAAPARARLRLDLGLGSLAVRGRF